MGEVRKKKSHMLAAGNLHVFQYGIINTYLHPNLDPTRRIVPIILSAIIERLSSVVRDDVVAPCIQHMGNLVLHWY